jgi:aryl-alcohol dehydrogenase
MKTKAAVVFEKSGKFSIEQLEISEPNDDEALVRIVATGICHTDLAGRKAGGAISKAAQPQRPSGECP